MKFVLPIILLMVVAATGGTASADVPADALAQGILKKGAIHVGVCEMPRVGDGTLAAALARAGATHVQGLAPDAASAMAARMPAIDDHSIGSQVTIETASPSAIPLQDWVADLLVVADATDANLKDIPPAEVRRVLSPYRGVAIVGRPRGGPGTLTVAALTVWANQLGGVAEVKDDQTGLWAVIKMPALPGGDDWSHYYHGPDGNPVSRDTVLKGPQFGLQWMGGPYWGGKFDVHVAAGGREFQAQSTIYWRVSGYPFLIRARSLYNGQTLWQRKIDPDFGDIGSLMVATPDRLYIKDGGSALALNAETGEEQLRYGSKDKDDCKWLMLSDGVLVTMIGPKRDKEWVSGQYNTGHTNAEQQAYENSTFVASEMDGWDAASGRQMWQFKAARIDPAKTVIRDGRIYTYADLKYAAALDLKTGNAIWKTPAPIEDPAGPYAGLPNLLNSILTPRQSAIATKDVYLINSLAHLQSVAFASGDGKLLWQKESGKGKSPKQTQADAQQMLNYPVAIGEVFYDKNGRWRGWDPLTGKPIAGRMLFNYAGCGHFTATESGLLFGQCGGVFNTGDNDWEVSDNYTKAACGVSQFVADGMLVKCPSDCVVCTEWQGFLVTHTRADPPSADPGVQLEKGPAFGIAPTETQSDDRDWPTYRSTNSRCAASSALLPGNLAIRWTFDPDKIALKVDPEGGNHSELPQTNPSPAIAVGDRVFFGTADGAVICLDAESGKQRWRYWTAGQITSAPTWYRGRIYVGSADGWVYCLTADSGELAWRYRMAPRDRRILVFGRLSSPWPVLANVLVQDGVAYATAGLVGTLDGTAIAALDARTGAVKWSQQFTADAQSDKAGDFPPSADGQLAWENGRIWWHVADSGIRVLDAATGRMKPAPDLVAMGVSPWAWRGINRTAFFRARGQDIGVMPGGWLAIGGRHFFLPGCDSGQPGDYCEFIQSDGKGNAAPDIYKLMKCQHCDYLPAWNDKEVLLGGSPRIFGQKEFPPRPLLWPGLTASLDALVQAHPVAINAKTSPYLSLIRETNLLPAPDQAQPAISDTLAKNTNLSWSSPVLAANGEVLLGQQWPKWSLFGFSRLDRHVLGQVQLPAQPIVGAMSLTRSGEILVPLIDGKILCLGAPLPDSK